MERFVIPHQHEITKEDRRRLNGHGSLILWFTGLPSSGKSTLANELEKELIQGGHRTYILDGDNVRMGLCKDLGFFRRGPRGEYKKNRRGIEAFHGRGNCCAFRLCFSIPR